MQTFDSGPAAFDVDRLIFNMDLKQCLVHPLGVADTRLLLGMGKTTRVESVFSTPGRVRMNLWLHICRHHSDQAWIKSTSGWDDDPDQSSCFKCKRGAITPSRNELHLSEEHNTLIQGYPTLYNEEDTTETLTFRPGKSWPIHILFHRLPSLQWSALVLPLVIQA